MGKNNSKIIIYDVDPDEEYIDVVEEVLKPYLKAVVMLLIFFSLIFLHIYVLLEVLK